MRLLLFIGLCWFSRESPAQIKAITDTGDKVILYSDGHWIYANTDSVRQEEIATNPKVFKKSKNADFLLKSKRTNAGFWLDPKGWTFTSPSDGSAAEYELDHKNGSLYALIITEHLDLTLAALGNIALQNAREAAPDVMVTAKEYRMVNGIKVLMMRMVGTIQDIRFSYFGYYYAANGIAVQYLAYSSEAYMDDHLSVVEDLLNGLADLSR